MTKQTTDSLSAGSTTVVVRVHGLEVTSMENYPPTQTMLDRGDTTVFCRVRYVSVWSSCYQRQLRYIVLDIIH